VLSLEHPSKVVSSTVTPFPKIAEVRFGQPANALVPTLVTELGTVIVRSPRKSLNADAPIVVTPSGIVTEATFCRRVRLLNPDARLWIVLTGKPLISVGMTMDGMATLACPVMVTEVPSELYSKFPKVAARAEPTIDRQAAMKTKGRIKEDRRMGG
jgi:hypothetical protein